MSQLSQEKLLILENFANIEELAELWKLIDGLQFKINRFKPNLNQVKFILQGKDLIDENDLIVIFHDFVEKTELLLEGVENDLKYES